MELTSEHAKFGESLEHPNVSPTGEEAIYIFDICIIIHITYISLIYTTYKYIFIDR